MFITDLERLHEYVNGMGARAEHHAVSAADKMYMIIGMLVGRECDMKIRIVQEKTGNQCTVTFPNGDQYCLVYGKDGTTINIKDRNNKGAILYTVTPETTVQDLYPFFGTINPDNVNPVHMKDANVRHNVQ